MFPTTLKQQLGLLTAQVWETQRFFFDWRLQLAPAWSRKPHSRLSLSIFHNPLPAVTHTPRVSEQRIGANKKPRSPLLVAVAASAPEVASCPSSCPSTQLLTILGYKPSLCRHHHLSPTAYKFLCFSLGEWLLWPWSVGLEEPARELLCLIYLLL